MKSNNDDEREFEGYDVWEGLASLPYHERLTHFIRGSTRHWVAGGVTVVDFRPLYAVTLHHLQRQLAQVVRKISKENITDQQLEEIRDILNRYTNSLRDFDFIHANRWNTHFVKDIAASRLDDGPGSELQAALISELELNSRDLPLNMFQDSDLLGSFDPKLLQHSTSIGKSLGTNRAQLVADEERQSRYRRGAKRFAFAIIGGLIIVVPMLILAIGVVTTKALAVISASIFVFAVNVAAFSKAEPENLLAATAAYAAVLVALVGEDKGISSSS